MWENCKPDTFECKIPTEFISKHFRKKYSNINSTGIHSGKNSALIDFNFVTRTIKPSYTFLEKINPFSKEKEAIYQGTPPIKELLAYAEELLEKNNYFNESILVKIERGALRFTFFEENEFEIEKQKLITQQKLINFG